MPRRAKPWRRSTTIDAMAAHGNTGYPLAVALCSGDMWDLQIEMQKAGVKVSSELATGPWCSVHTLTKHLKACNSLPHYWDWHIVRRKLKSNFACPDKWQRKPGYLRRQSVLLVRGFLIYREPSSCRPTHFPTFTA